MSISHDTQTLIDYLVNVARDAEDADDLNLAAEAAEYLNRNLDPAAILVVVGDLEADHARGVDGGAAGSELDEDLIRRGRVTEALEALAVGWAAELAAAAARARLKGRK